MEYGQEQSVYRYTITRFGINCSKTEPNYDPFSSILDFEVILSQNRKIVFTVWDCRPQGAGRQPRRHLLCLATTQSWPYEGEALLARR